MDEATRDAFERFAKDNQQSASKTDISRMVTYIEERGVHSVYCKIKAFMPRHHQALQEAVQRMNDKK